MSVLLWILQDKWVVSRYYVHDGGEVIDLHKPLSRHVYGALPSYKSSCRSKENRRYMKMKYNTLKFRYQWIRSSDKNYYILSDRPFHL